MAKEEIAKRFCKFELCTHRNGEGMCCLYNQDNCIFHKLEKENAKLKEANIELQKLVQQREQRGLEVQEDLLKEIEQLKPREIDNCLTMRIKKIKRTDEESYTTNNR